MLLRLVVSYFYLDFTIISICKCFVNIFLGNRRKAGKSRNPAVLSGLFPFRADKFPQERIAGNDGRIQSLEGVQEFQQPLRFGIMGAFLVNGAQQGLGVGLQHGQLVRQGRVENRISVFLIGVNIHFFAAAHVSPYVHRIQRAAVAELLIPYHAADNPRVGRRNAVVVVDADLRQYAQGNLIFFVQLTQLLLWLGKQRSGYARCQPL